jgi:hypothetical protein
VAPRAPRPRLGRRGGARRPIVVLAPTCAEPFDAPPPEGRSAGPTQPPPGAQRAPAPAVRGNADVRRRLHHPFSASWFAKVEHSPYYIRDLGIHVAFYALAKEPPSERAAAIMTVCKDGCGAFVVLYAKDCDASRARAAVSHQSVMRTLPHRDYAG